MVSLVAVNCFMGAWRMVRNSAQTKPNREYLLLSAEQLADSVVSGAR
jgi:hypothetical protein